MIHQLSQHRQYHNYLTIHVIASAFCLGHDVILKVTTNDTNFFNPKSAVWPKRPEIEWVFHALNGDLSDVLLIHFQSFFVPLNDDDNDDETQEAAAAAAFHSKARVTIDLRQTLPPPI